MTLTSVDTDRQALTLTVTSHYDAPIDRVWELWADPRLLERWWGPPTYPATVTKHDLTPGGAVEYHMTGPEGDVHGGWWRVTAVEPPHLLEFEDGFSDAHGNPVHDMPKTTSRVGIETEDGRVRMTVETSFQSLEAMEQLIEMGMEEGIKLAVGQIDAILEEVRQSAIK